VEAMKSDGKPSRRLPAPETRLQTSAEEAVSYIRRLIFDGELPGGTRVPQDEIAEALGRSRVPVREALIALEREGWITVIPNRGAYVATFTPVAVRDHYELLGFTYGLAARRAVENNQPELDKRLLEISAELKDVDDVDRFHRATLAFHAAVVDAADSPRIRTVLRSMSAMVPGNFFERIPGSAAVEKRHTTAIRRAIANRDAGRAAAQYQAMLRRHADQVVDLLDRHGFFTRQRAV
jgi:DNA-binding GntR family transcriptional regulator